MYTRNTVFKSAFILRALLAYICTAHSANEVQGELIIFNDNGGWCWYQDERVLVHDGKFIIGSLADGSGTGGNSRDGNVEVTTYTIASEDSERNILGHPAGGDDHNTVAFLLRPDNRYLAVYASHGDDRLMRWRISQPGNSTSWSAEKTIDVGDGNTYSNLYRLSEENNGNGRTYNFHRGRGYNPNCMISDDDGDTWTYGGRLLQGSGRPYVKYTSNNRDVIHFTNTEQHPRDYNNSIYHGLVRNGRIYNSSGTEIDNNLFDESGPSPTAPTLVYRGNADNVAWTSELHLDVDENPYMGFTVQKNSAGLPTGRGGDDIRYHYARWDGNTWNQNEIAYAGSRLYSGEDDYTGNMALDPDNPNILYISTNANPETGEALRSSADNRRHYELYKGTTRDNGENWTWTPITENSTTDNIRPIVPKWNRDSTALLWMRGTYRSYTDYDCDIVGIILVEAAIRVLAPQENDTLRTGSEYEITWSSEGTSGPVAISYAVGAGDWQEITSSTENDGSFTWTVPDIVNDSIRIRVEAPSVNVSAENAGMFAIVSSETSVRSEKPNQPVIFLVDGLPLQVFNIAQGIHFFQVFTPSGKFLAKIPIMANTASWNSGKQTVPKLAKGIYYLKAGERVFPFNLQHATFLR